MARSREFKLMMKFIYWFCVVGIICFVGYIGWEIFLTVNQGMGGE